jgi:hypothetical protein
VSRLQLVLDGVGLPFFFYNAPQRIVTFCYILDLRGPNHIRRTSNPTSAESVIKIFSNWHIIMRWFAILLQYSCYPETSLTQLYNKPLPKRVQTSTVTGTCIEKMWPHQVISNCCPDHDRTRKVHDLMRTNFVANLCTYTNSARKG